MFADIFLNIYEGPTYKCISKSKDFNFVLDVEEGSCLIFEYTFETENIVWKIYTTTQFTVHKKMSRVTRRKHVLKEMMEDELPTNKQQIVKVIRSPGSNLHEVESANIDDEHFLVSMPMKFRNNIWIKRGDYLLVEPIEEGIKVKAEICKILTAEHIKEYTKANIWPERFVKKNNQYYNNDVIYNKYVDIDSDSDSDSDGEADDLEPNMNRPVPSRTVEEDSEEDDEDDEEYISSEED